MGEANHQKYVFFAIAAILSYLFYLILKPYLNFLILGLVLAFTLNPAYKKVLTITKRKKIASILTIIFILAIIIIPLYFIVNNLVTEAASVLQNIGQSDFEKINEILSSAFNQEINIQSQSVNVLIALKSAIIGSGISFIGGIANFLIGMLIFFIILFYGFIEGENWFKKVSDILPFKKNRKDELVKKIEKVISNVLYGEVMMAIMHGILGGIGLWIIGVENPIFWGVVIAVLAFLPFVGSGLVWIPAGLLQFLSGHTWQGIFIFIYEIIVIAGVEYFIRPQIVAKGSEVHPATVFLGAFGGLAAFGMIGLIIGPLIAALFMTVFSFYYEDYAEKKIKNK